MSESAVAVAVASLLDEIPPASLAPLLRSWADRLDPPAAAASARDVVWKTRDETRRIQATLLQVIGDYVVLSPNGGAEDGLLWFPSEALRSMRYFAAVERNPNVRLR